MVLLSLLANNPEAMGVITRLRPPIPLVVTRALVFRRRRTRQGRYPPVLSYIDDVSSEHPSESFESYERS